MKVRILYPTVTQAQGIEGEAGDIVGVDDTLAEAMIVAGFAEAADAKGPSGMYDDMTKAELVDLARERGISVTGLNKDDLIAALNA